MCLKLCILLLVQAGNVAVIQLDILSVCVSDVLPVLQGKYRSRLIGNIMEKLAASTGTRHEYKW